MAPTPQRVGTPVENGSTTRKREGVGTQVENGPPDFPAQADNGSEMKTVRERFRNGTGRELLWSRFGTVSEPFPDPFWVTCHLGVPFWNPSGTLSLSRVFWGTLFRTFSGTCSRNCRLPCQCGGGNFQTHAFEGTSLAWAATTLVKCFGNPLWSFKNFGRLLAQWVEVTVMRMHWVGLLWRGPFKGQVCVPRKTLCSKRWEGVPKNSGFEKLYKRVGFVETPLLLQNSL